MFNKIFKNKPFWFGFAAWFLVLCFL